jgi:hypothetical protein
MSVPVIDASVSTEEVMRARSARRGDPRLYARWAGALALVLVVLSAFSMVFVPAMLYVPGDATATAQKIIASEWLFRLGVLSDLAICLTEVVLVTLLYALFKPVSPLVSLMAAFSRLAMAVVQGVNVAGSVAVLLVLGGAASSSAFTADQSNVLAQLILNTHEQGVFIWQAIFALHCLLLGYLIFRSGFVPKILGALMVVAALGYLANGVVNLSYPAGKATLAAVVAVTAIFGELPFFLWLLIKTVNADAWHELVRTRRSETP